MLWENLDTPAWQRLLRRLLVVLGVVLVLVGSLLFTLVGQVQQTKFEDKIPQLSLCEDELPALYYGSYANISGSTRLERPSVFQRESQDGSCPQTPNRGFYVTMPVPTPEQRYDLSLCQGAGASPPPPAGRSLLTVLHSPRRRWLPHRGREAVPLPVSGCRRRVQHSLMHPTRRFTRSSACVHHIPGVDHHGMLLPANASG